MALMRQVSVDGKYYILITLFGRELRGSPFKAVLLPGKRQRPPSLQGRRMSGVLARVGLITVPMSTMSTGECGLSVSALLCNGREC